MGRVIYGAILGALFGSVFVPVGFIALAASFKVPMNISFGSIGDFLRVVFGICSMGAIAGAVIGGVAGAVVDPKVELTGDVMIKAIKGVFAGLVPGFFVGSIGSMIFIGVGRLTLNLLGMPLPTGRDYDLIACAIGSPLVFLLLVPLGAVADKSKVLETIMTVLTCGLFLILCIVATSFVPTFAESVTIGGVLGAALFAIVSAKQEAEKP